MTRIHIIPRRDNARPLLLELHWLSVARRVDFKILVLTYKAMHDEAPVYLCKLVRPYQPARALRSAISNSLEVKRTGTKAGDGSFTVAAASPWNAWLNFIKTCDTLASVKCRHISFVSHISVYSRWALSFSHSSLFMTILVILFSNVKYQSYWYLTLFYQYTLSLKLLL